MNSEAPPRATRRQWIGLAVIALPCMLYSVDLTVLNLAVPSISAELNPSASQLLWIIDIYGFMVAGLLITMGSLGDRIGRRRLLLIGAAAFGVASVLAAFSTSAEMLIAMRALLGIAGATLAPSIRNMFHDPGERTTAIGVDLELLGRRGDRPGARRRAARILLVGLGVPRQRAGDAAAAGARPRAVAQVPRSRLAPARPAERGAVAGRRAGDDLRSEAHRRARRGLAAGAVHPRRTGHRSRVPAQAGQAGQPADRPAPVPRSRVQRVAGHVHAELLGDGDPADRAPRASLLRDRRRPDRRSRRLRGARASGRGVGLPIILVATVAMSLGLAPVFTLATDLVVGAAPPERAGAASAISETSSEFGGALGIAIFGSIGTAVYRGAMADAVPAGVPPDVAEAARSTLGAAVALANQLPGPLGAALRDASRAAFVQGLQLTAVIAAVAMIGTAVMAAVMHARARAAAEPVDRPAAAIDRGG